MKNINNGNDFSLSDSPILLLINFKVIGIHKGKAKYQFNERSNIKLIGKFNSLFNVNKYNINIWNNNFKIKNIKILI